MLHIASLLVLNVSAHLIQIQHNFICLYLGEKGEEEEKEVAVVNSIQFPLEYNTVKFTFTNIGYIL